jgi:hypothetical protein
MLSLARTAENIVDKFAQYFLFLSWYLGPQCKRKTTHVNIKKVNRVAH